MEKDYDEVDYDEVDYKEKDYIGKYYDRDPARKNGMAGLLPAMAELGYSPVLLMHPSIIDWYYYLRFESPANTSAECTNWAKTFVDANRSFLSLPISDTFYVEPKEIEIEVKKYIATQQEAYPELSLSWTYYFTDDMEPETLARLFPPFEIGPDADIGQFP